MIKTMPYLLVFAALMQAPPAYSQDVSGQVAATYAEFGKQLNSDNVDGILELFGEDAVFLPSPGKVVSGRDSIRATMNQFAQTSEKFESKVRTVVSSGDTALAIVDWSLEGKDANGQELRLAGSTSDVLRRDPDGVWKFIIDNPFGTSSGN
jgi:uncharacterized protein (TIGR02246 family)